MYTIKNIHNAHIYGIIHTDYTLRYDTYDAIHVTQYLLPKINNEKILIEPQLNHNISTLLTILSIYRILLFYSSLAEYSVTSE